jgi:type II secretory pathway component PulM
MVLGFWSASSKRERTVLALGTAFALGALLYALLLEPGMSARQSLSATLPRLRAQLADMRVQRAEIAGLRKQLEAAPQRGDLHALLRASALQQSFAGSVEHTEALPSGGALVRMGPVGFDAWLDWLERMQREFGARLEACRIRALGRPGLVQVEARFAARGAPGSTR